MAKGTVGVRLYRSSVKGRRPAVGDMAYGDLAVNYNHEDPALIVKGDDNVLIEFKPGSRVTVDAAAPTAAKDGDLWWDTSSARLFLRYTSGAPATGAWVDASPAAVPPTLANALTYKGTIDPTAAGSAPAGPSVGDTYVASKAGTAAAGWTGLAGTSVLLHELLVWDGASWDGAGAAASPRTAWQGAVDPTAAKPTGFSAVAGDLVQLSKVGVVHGDWPGVSARAAVGDVYVFTGTAWSPVGDGGSGVWSRTGTTLSPATAGDLVAAAALPAATAGAHGAVQLASLAEVQAGTDDAKAVTPKQISGAFLSKNISTLPALP